MGGGRKEGRGRKVGGGGRDTPESLRAPLQDFNGSMIQRTEGGERGGRGRRGGGARSGDLPHSRRKNHKKT